jgi:predicted MFS family arabinose efflux permease
MIILFGYIASSPFIYQKIYGLSPVGFSLCFALNALFTAFGCALSGKVGDERKALKIAGVGMLVFAIAVAAALMMHAVLPLVQVAFMGLTFMFGMSQPPATALALNAERTNAGTAAAAIGASGFLMRNRLPAGGHGRHRHECINRASCGRGVDACVYFGNGLSPLIFECPAAVTRRHITR